MRQETLQAQDQTPYSSLAGSFFRIREWPGRRHAVIQRSPTEALEILKVQVKCNAKVR